MEIQNENKKAVRWIIEQFKRVFFVALIKLIWKATDIIDVLQIVWCLLEMLFILCTNAFCGLCEYLTSIVWISNIAKNTFWIFLKNKTFGLTIQVSYFYFVFIIMWLLILCFYVLLCFKVLK